MMSTGHVLCLQCFSGSRATVRDVQGSFAIKSLMMAADLAGFFHGDQMTGTRHGSELPARQERDGPAQIHESDIGALLPLDHQRGTADLFQKRPGLRSTSRP